MHDVRSIDYGLGNYLRMLMHVTNINTCLWNIYSYFLNTNLYLNFTV